MPNFRINILEGIQIAWGCMILHFLPFLQTDYYPFCLRSFHACLLILAHFTTSWISQMLRMSSFLFYSVECCRWFKVLNLYESFFSSSSFLLHLFIRLCLIFYACFLDVDVQLLYQHFEVQVIWGYLVFHFLPFLQAGILIAINVYAINIIC